MVEDAKSQQGVGFSCQSEGEDFKLTGGSVAQSLYKDATACTVSQSEGLLRQNEAVSFPVHRSSLHRSAAGVLQLDLNMKLSKDKGESAQSSQLGNDSQLREQDYMGLAFGHSEGMALAIVSCEKVQVDDSSHEGIPDLNIGQMELRLAPPEGLEVQSAQESANDDALCDPGPGLSHRKPQFEEKGVCAEQISCREKPSSTMPVSNMGASVAEKASLKDTRNMASDKASTETDQKEFKAFAGGSERDETFFSRKVFHLEKQAAEPGSSRLIAANKQAVGESMAGASFWHDQKLQQQQHMAATQELTPFHLALRAQQQTEINRHGWGGALNGLTWSGIFVPGAQDLGNNMKQGYSQMLVYAGYGHELGVSNVAPAPLSQPGVAASNTHAKGATASGPVPLGSPLQGKMLGNTGFGIGNSKPWPASSLYNTAEVNYSARNATVKEERANTSSPAVVGWPPVQSFRKNSMVASQSKPPSEGEGPSAASPVQLAEDDVISKFVKVYMDGVPIGRKVDLKANNSYEKLSTALEEMFQQFIIGRWGLDKLLATREKPLPSNGKQLNFSHGSDYVMTYEDKDGDLMLVGDVPWSLFASTVKRLRIMKGCEAIGFE
ncbi:hypothetical protein O6H91_11G006000 [Diphasiastrum complanatum]|uniref:Uncharacterized protein n=1 Tax=Diphasiastrum complanatum TaxID=34168 RepID=A0ACC2C620_DIPCM|nr:hypothetical protein O6H91_11G006000 [Diphasiastrum complanatum]